MARQIIDNGTYDNDPGAEKIRLAFNKTNDNFEELYGYLTGTGKAQERIIQHIESNESELVEVANSVNAASTINKPRDTVQIISFIDNYGSGLDVAQYFKKRQYILKRGEGVYGSGGTPVLPTDFIILTPNIIGRNEATTFDLGDILGADIHTYVNGSGPYLVLGTTIFETTEGSYVFSGSDGLYGNTATPTTADNFIPLSDGEESNRWQKIHNLSLVGITTDGVDELTYIKNAVVMHGPFTCEPDQQIILRTQTPNGSGYIERYYSVLPRVTTIGGPSISVVLPSYFKPDGQSINADIDGNILIELGDIVSGPVETYFNLGDGGAPWDMNVKRFIRGTLDSVVTLWSWQGIDGEFGGSGIPATADDFFLITGEPVVPIGQLYDRHPDIASMLSDQGAQSIETIMAVTDASADTNITFPIGETKLQAYYQYLGTANGLISDYRLISAPYGNHLEEAPEDSLVYGRKNGGWVEANGIKQIIKTGNFVLAELDNGATISMDGGDCVINPNVLPYPDAYQCIVKNITDSTDGNIVFSADVGWTYKLNDDATVASGTFPFPAGAICKIIKFEGVNKFYVNILGAGSSELTSDELAAVQGAATPSAANVFATMADVGGGGDSYLYNVIDYGALGDGIQLLDGAITASDATFTSASASFSAGDIGKIIHIQGAGASGAYHTTTIASINSPTSVEITAVAVTTVSGKIFVYGTENTQFIQDAINACFNGGGGTVFIPNGIYLLNGALQNNIGVDSIDYNSQIYIPFSQISEQILKTVTIKGETPPFVPNGAGINTIQKVTLSGACLLSTITGSGTDPSVICSRGLNSGTFADLMNITQSYYQNLNILTTANGNLKATVGGINCFRSVVSGFDKCTVFLYNIDLTDSTEPNLINVTGISYSGVNATKLGFINNCNVGGFTNGYRIGEHGMIANTGANCCVNAILVETNYHTATVLKFHSDWCKYGISFNGDANINVVDLMSEQRVLGSWYDTVALVNDPNNYGRGVINYNIVEAGVGFNNDLFYKIGGKNINAIPISVNSLVNEVVGTAYSFKITDSKKITYSTSASETLFTIPNDSVDNFDIGAVLEVAQRGDGVLKINPVGVSLESPKSTSLRTKYSRASIKKIDVNSWILEGDLADSDTSDGLVSYWKFDGNSNDASGNAHNGTDTSMTYGVGKVDDCAEFNGTTGKIIVPDSDGFSFTNGTSDVPFTIIIPFYFNNKTGTQFLMNKRIALNEEWQVSTNGTLLSFVLYGATTSDNILKSVALSGISINTWYHLIIRYDGSETHGGLSLRLDKVEVGTSSAAGTYTGTVNGTANVTIGKRGTDDAAPFNGKLDEVAIYWNRELTDVECDEAADRFIAGLPLIP